MQAMKATRKQPNAAVKADLLVVEDELDLQELLQYNLSRDGFSVRSVGTGEDAIKAVRQQQPRLILLDLMLPGMDGLEVCRKLKSDEATSDILVVMLTAKGEEADIVAGLELGADDYVTKPFSPRVLLARIKAVLRRASLSDTVTQDETTALIIGDLTIDPDRHEVRVAGESVSLTRTEFLILQLMGRRPGRVFTRAQIVQGAQGDLVAVTDRSVDVHIVSLRRKLGAVGKYIQTVRGVGYRLEETEA